jgi:predicted nucleic acid-binding protein
MYMKLYVHLWKRKLDFVDATIVTLAERLDIQKILTVDVRDFRTIRPKHCVYFDIVPS